MIFCAMCSLKRLFLSFDGKIYDPLNFLRDSIMAHNFSWLLVKQYRGIHWKQTENYCSTSRKEANLARCLRQEIQTDEAWHPQMTSQAAGSCYKGIVTDEECRMCVWLFQFGISPTKDHTEVS